MAMRLWVRKTSKMIEKMFTVNSYIYLVKCLKGSGGTTKGVNLRADPFMIHLM